MKTKIACPICRTPTVIGKTQVKNSLGCQRLFSHCPNCDHWWLNPMPDVEELNIYYHARTGMVTTGYVQQYPQKKLKIFLAILSAQRFHEKTSVLEIGPGPVGITPIVPKGAMYIAVEPSIAYKKSLKTIAENRNLHFHAYDSINMIPKDTRVDMMFTNAVFEHLIDPLNTFTTAASLLNPGAAVVFGVPDRNVEIPDHAFIPSGLFKSIDYCENHLHSFSPASVKALFEQGGVELVEMCHTLKQGLVTAYYQISHVLEDGVINRRMMSGRWILKYLRSLFTFKIASYIIDRRRTGDDRCEVIYIGVKR